MHAQNYGTLLNTAVAVKEMVHQIFKGMVPHTNLKQVELDLLRRYNTLQAFRYIVDGGVDHRFGGCFDGFENLVGYDVGRVLKQWFIFEDPMNIVAHNHNSETDEDLGKANEGNIISCLTTKS